MTSNKTKGRVLCAAVGLLMPLLATSVASADASAPAKTEAEKVDDNERVRALFHNGETAFEAGRYEEARGAFLDAWSVRQTYDVASSLAQVELKLHRYRDAAEHLDYCLRHFAPSESAKILERVQKGFAAAKSHVGAVKVTSNREGAEIFVDSVRVGTAPLPAVVFVEPGKRRIAARVNGESSEQFVNAEAGKDYVAELTLQAGLVLPFETDGPPAGALPPPVPGVVSGGAEPPPATDQSRSVQPRTIALWSGVGVTAVAAGVGLIFALKGSSANSDAKDHAQTLPPGSCPSPENATSCAALEDSLSDRESANKIANISFVVAGVAAVATATMFFVWPRRRAETARHVQIVPIATRDAGGLIINASF
jgi:hypothetical protein